MNLRTPIKQARGVGSSGEGVHHWWLHRVSAIALIPLTLWFVAGVIGIVAQDYEAAVAWVRDPWVTVLLLLFVSTVFHHSMLGIQVVVEDYVHQRTALVVSLLLNTFLHYLFAAAALVAVLRISLGA